MEKDAYYKSRLRSKGQITIPSEVRDFLSIKEGDELFFHVDENDQVVVERAITIPADQAWFWTERWQQMEREAQADIDAGRVRNYENMDDALEALGELDNAEDTVD